MKQQILIKILQQWHCNIYIYILNGILVCMYACVYLPWLSVLPLGVDILAIVVNVTPESPSGAHCQHVSYDCYYTCIRVRYDVYV
jgi:hypothetical protein